MEFLFGFFLYDYACHGTRMEYKCTIIELYSPPALPDANAVPLPGEALVPCGHAGPWPKWRAFVLARTTLREQIADVLYFRSTPQLGADAGGLFAPERLHGAAHRIAS